MAAFDPKDVSPIDWGIIGGGALGLIALFLPWWGLQTDLPAGLGNVRTSNNAFQSGFFAWFGILLIIAAAGVVVARLLGRQLADLPVGPALLVLGLAALGTLFVLLRLLTFDSESAFGIEVGRKVGSWIGLLAGIIASAAAYLSFSASGEKLSFGTTGSRSASPPPPPPPPAAPATDYAAPPAAPPAPPAVNPLETGGPPPPPAPPAPPELPAPPAPPAR